MNQLDLKTYPDRILRKKLRKVNKITPEEKEVFEKMLSLMEAKGGIGLAANQAGIDKQLFVVDLKDGRGPFFVINPVIAKKEGTAEMEEGCLSVPNAVVKIKRAEKVTIEGLDAEGKPLRIEAEGLLARVFQHEIDHLCGKLIIDYLKLPLKLKVVSFLKKNRRS